MFHNNGICGGCALVLVDLDDGLGIMGIACGFGGATAKVGPAFCHWLKSRWNKLGPEAKPGGNIASMRRTVSIKRSWYRP